MNRPAICRRAACARLALQSALRQTQSLLLDEPFAGMNHDETMNMVNLVRSVRDERGVTVMLVEHDMPAVMTYLGPDCCA